MLDIKKIREDFPMLKRKMQGHDLVYFDNAATSLKPTCVLDAIEYYQYHLGANAHPGNHELGFETEAAYEKARRDIANFLGADADEIVVTSGATEALNIAANVLTETYLKPGDEVLITVAEHAANVLPWFKLQRKVGIVVNMIPLDEIGRLTLDNVKKSITEKTKIISIAHVTNVLGYLVDIKGITEYAHERGIFVVVDGAQSTPHMKIDVKDLDCDAFCVSGHKVLGPTGVGVLYMKRRLLDEVEPFTLGGGMNEMFHSNGEYFLQKAPIKFEAGTPKIEGALGLAAGMNYLAAIGMDAIHERELHLKEYALSKLKKLDNIVIYNEKADCGLITFNLKGVFAQDAATHFNSYGIAIRAGNHCAKMLGEFLGVQMTCRASIYFYNTEEEVDRFVEAVSKGSDYLGAFFK